MPTYDYSCSECGGFEALRSLSVRNDPAPCPECGSASQRMLSAAPALALMEATTRTAMSVNERARHEPQRSGDYQRLKHPGGCGCCGAGKRGATVTGANGNKAFPSKRPWMISH